MTSGQFEEACAVLGIVQRAGWEAERRLPRLECRQPIVVAVLDGTTLLPPVESVVRDICPKGATLSHGAVLKVGTRLVLHLGNQAAGMVKLLGVVTQSKCFSDGQSLVTVEFQGLMKSPNRRIA